MVWYDLVLYGMVWHNSRNQFVSVSLCSLQAEEAEVWHRKALELSPLEGRDACLYSLGSLLCGQGHRLEEAVDLIVR